MRPLLAGQGRSLGEWVQCVARLYLDLHALAAYQVQTGATLPPTAPVAPEDGGSGHQQGMQEHTHLAGLGSSLTLPLTLRAQRTGATTADAGPIDHP